MITSSMNIFSRILLGLVLVVTLLTGGLLVFSVVKSGMEGPVTANAAGMQDEESSFDRILARLPLLPVLTGERKLVGIIIENHQGARPYQQSLKDALFVQEFFVEGLITRFLVLLDTRSLPEIIGPVRSLRPYFVDSALPWTDVIIHAGGSPEAFERTRELPVTAINGLAHPKEFYRHTVAAAPHNLFTTATLMKKLIPADSDPVRWPPYETGGAPTGENASTIEIDFHSSTHDVRYDYQGVSGYYDRTNGDTEHQGEPRNVLILESPILGVGEVGRLEISMEGRGHALLFRSGHVYEGFWTKKNAKDSYQFFLEEGEPMIFATGQTWMTVLDSLERVSWSE
jgi:hypothetical protein